MEILEQFATWSTAYVDDLPDSAFLYVEDGEKDSDGKTTPRSKRHFPYRDANGDVDLPHLRNALARIPQSNLPAAVKKAATAKAEKILAQHNGEQQTADTTGLERFVALAPMTHVDVRDPSKNPDDTWTFSGYAAVYNQRAIVKNARDFRLEYEIAPDAFAQVLTTQNLAAGDGVVHFNINHNMDSVIAASDVPWGQPGSLRLASDAHGLQYMVKASRDDPDAVKLAVKLRDGIVKQASVAFVCGEHEITQTEAPDGSDVVLRRIMSASLLVDVCATPQGVFHQASSQLQQFASNIFGQPEVLGGHPRQPADGGGASFVSPEASGGVASHMKPRLSASEVKRINAHRRAA